MATDTVLMARPKKARSGNDREQYRKPFTPVRIRGILAEPAKEAASEMAQDFAVWVNDAVRMRLVSEGRWPPRPKS